LTRQLKISVGQYSDKGRKEINQDFHDACIPSDPLLSSKGIALAIADGISSSDVSQVASKAAVTSFLSDYFDTPEAWSVKTAAQRVLVASNSWLYSQSRQSQYRYDRDKGYVCTLSAMVIKSTTAHIFHIGDARIYRLLDNSLEQLTEDHRLWVSENESHLSRALGISQQVEIDYQSVQVEPGDIFIMATDGVYEFADACFIVDAINVHRNDLDTAAKSIVEEAYAQGSKDNLSLQIIRVNTLPVRNADELYQHLTDLPFPPILEARMEFDGYSIIREIHASSRSHVYLALEKETNTRVVLKMPSIDLRGEPAYLERFLMEEWIGRRIDNAHVLKSCAQTRKRNYLYIVTEYIEGQTLAQWMRDNPKPEMETVRGIIEQIARGLGSFHRQEMLHQDIRPANIMIDNTGSVKIIDFGSARVAGIAEINSPIPQEDLLGTAQYSAPEYFLGENPDTRSDLFSLGVITYQMLTGTLPYGIKVSQARTKIAQNNLTYRSVLADDREIPAWVDLAIKKAVQPNPQKRYQELSEFVFDLRQPNKEFLNRTRPPLMERNPLVFWKSVSFILAIIVMILITRLGT